jgi:23S rRNA (cytosine1962-C5)-methyltransferase
MPWPIITLKSGKDHPVRRGHPWVFSGAIRSDDRQPEVAGIVLVQDNKKRPLGLGFFNPASQIRIRMLSRRTDVHIRAGFVRDRIAAALARRATLLGSGTDAFRLIHAEADGLPGLIVDKYAGFCVLQFHTRGAEWMREHVIGGLEDVIAPSGLFERSDLDVRRHEGLERGAVGTIAGNEPPEVVAIEENGLRFHVDLRRGQKTGFFLDQRDNRARVRGLCAGARVLNCYAYSGATSAAALAGGADQVVSIDTDADALALAERNIALNDLSSERHAVLRGDVREKLEQFRRKGEQFDLVILDPPAFAKHRKALKNALYAYRSLNAQALALLPPGGFLLTSSCSGLVSREAFRDLLADAARDANTGILLLGDYPQPPDHPLIPAFSEGDYLKTCLIQKVD